MAAKEQSMSALCIDSHRVRTRLNMRNRQMVANIKKLIRGGRAASQGVGGGLGVEGLS